VTILDEILAHKREEVALAKQALAPHEMCARAEAMPKPTRGFARALAESPAPAIIAELKRRSPSKGVIREDFDPVRLAGEYERGGAATLSVLTDERYFGGELGFLAQVKEAVALPLLRKDFTVDLYQIDEARAAGADAVLLIVAALERSEIEGMQERAWGLGLDVLVEVHDEADLDVALGAGAKLIGVNNRDLRTFEVDLGVTERLARLLPAESRPLLVAESGIKDAAAVERLEKAGANGFLVGESLMREQDVARALRQLRRQF
jgi:indole-3-glycerol phosphate synthase